MFNSLWFGKLKLQTFQALFNAIVKTLAWIARGRGFDTYRLLGKVAILNEGIRRALAWDNLEDFANAELYVKLYATAVLDKIDELGIK